jgi:hypothetical protein
MKRIISFSILTALIIGFQNCAKIQLQESPKNQASVSMNPVTSQPATFNPNSADKLLIPNNPNIENSKAGPSLNSDIYYFQINLTTGGISSYDFNEEVLQNKTFCLSDSDLNELKSILNNAAVCDKTSATAEATPDSSNSSEKLCTAVYKEPYASLIFGDSEVKLGEAKSGCDEPVDLCGAHKDLLKGFVTNLLKNISTKSCLIVFFQL